VNAANCRVSCVSRGDAGRTVRPAGEEEEHGVWRSGSAVGDGDVIICGGLFGLREGARVTWCKGGYRRQDGEEQSKWMDDEEGWVR
jgi:hypothetical protein